MLAAKVEDDVFAVDRSVSGADTALRGVVRITTVDEVLHAVAPALAEFREAYPGIVLDVDTDLRAASLTRREADIALRPGVAPTEPDVVGYKLVGMSYAFYAKLDHGFHLWLLIHADLRQTARVRAFVDALSASVRAQRSLYEGGAPCTRLDPTFDGSVGVDACAVSCGGRRCTRHLRRYSGSECACGRRGRVRP